jgi:hypothetical protein
MRNATLKKEVQDSFLCSTPAYKLLVFNVLFVENYTYNNSKKHVHVSPVTEKNICSGASLHDCSIRMDQMSFIFGSHRIFWQINETEDSY